MAQYLSQGGSERQLVEIAKALDPEKFSVHVGCFHPQGFRSAELARQNIPILHLPVYSFQSMAAVRGAWKLGGYIRRNRIQLVHTFDTPMNCFAVPVARAFRTPVVLSSQRASRRLCRGWEQKALRVTDRLVTAVVVNCEAMRRHMTDEEGVADKHLRLCYNGLDASLFERSPVPRHPGLGDASLVIGVVCALRPEKGLPTLLEAFARVVAGAASDKRSRLRVAIVGSGPMLEPLRALSIKLGIQGRCHFEPSTPDVARWLREIDIFVLPSLSEALSNSLMEAMACGCAVVASEVGGNPELVAEGRTGLLFPAGDASALADRIESLIKDDELRNRLATAAAAEVRRRFSLEASVGTMEAIYDEMLARGAKN